MQSDPSMAKMPENLLVTGCYRSGTTLVEKLLHAHPQMIVASQAYPVLFSYAKERFLEARGLQRRYPLDHLFLESDYTQADFDDYLRAQSFDQKDIDTIFERLEGFAEPGWTPELLSYRERIEAGTFWSLLEQFNICLAAIFPKAAAKYVGTKEIMVEEYLPVFLQAGGHVVLVIRDPRDMVLSTHFSEKQFVGANRPILYSLRAWRRSVAYGLAFEGHPRLQVIRFEDLVRNPMVVLAQMVNEMDLDAYREDAFTDGVRDQRGALWQSNSSFASSLGINPSAIGQFEARLAPEVIAYVETACYPEMKALGYTLHAADGYDPRRLTEFVEPFDVTHGRFSDAPDYSMDALRLENELQRMHWLRADEAIEEEEARRWFIHAATYNRLKEAMHSQASERH